MSARASQDPKILPGDTREVKRTKGFRASRTGSARCSAQRREIESAANATRPKVYDFIERAKASGASEASLVGILTARGWPEKEVYEALAVQYERLTGISIPNRTGGATAAKDVFFYLLIFSTLATWTIALGSMAFTLIDWWLTDTLFSPGYTQAFESYNIAAAMASMLVAFPIFLLVSRAVVRDARSNPEKLNSPVRKWLTYLALVIAAGVLIGDLIAALTYLLRGEITSRFLAKSCVVLVLSGGVFFYYFFGLRKPEEPEVRSRFGRDAWMAAVSGAAVVVMIVLGFAHIGAPSAQRILRADQKRVQDLYQISLQINTHWNTGGKKIPEHLDELRNTPLADPITRTAYEYRVKEGSKYELCGVFSAPSKREKSGSNNAWSHPAGRYCYSLDAAQQPENPLVYIPD